MALTRPEAAPAADPGAGYEVIRETSYEVAAADLYRQCEATLTDALYSKTVSAMRDQSMDTVGIPHVRDAFDHLRPRREAFKWAAKAGDAMFGAGLSVVGSEWLGADAATVKGVTIGFVLMLVGLALSVRFTR